MRCVLVGADTYKCSAISKHKKSKFSKSHTTKVNQSHCKNKYDGKRMWVQGDDNFEILKQHGATFTSTTVDNVPLQIISPATQLIWMWMCDNWRKNLDFNFKRPANWNDSMDVYNFNHSFYVKYHNILDWHDFVWLRNNSFLYQGVVVDPHLVNVVPQTLYYIDSITYEIPDEIKNLSTQAQLKKIDKYEWQPECCVHFRRLWKRMHEWVLQDRIETIEVFGDENWSVCDLKQFEGVVVRRVCPTNNYDYETAVLPPPERQHPDVASNKPFFFFIFGCDKYHHTQFTGLKAMDTHGCYWWIGNYNRKFQFTRACSMSVCQAPACIPFTTIFPKIYDHWEYLMNDGCLLWTNDGLTRVNGMVSHHIADMQDRDVMLRRRGCNKNSRCDGMLWFGVREGIRWPSNCENLLQLNVVVPGNYLLKCKKYLQQKFAGDEIHEDVGKVITLTTTKHDVYNNLPICSTLKCPIEINHTTMLGLLVVAFTIEWTRLHTTGGFKELETRANMVAYLNKFWSGVNGVSSYIKSINTNIMTFNQIHHSWQKMVEIMIALPHVVDWNGKLNLLTNIIRMTGCLHTCTNENRRKELQSILKELLIKGLVCSCLEFLFLSFP